MSNRDLLSRDLLSRDTLYAQVRAQDISHSPPKLGGVPIGGGGMQIPDVRTREDMQIPAVKTRGGL